MEIDAESLTLHPQKHLKPEVSVDTYNDHRMAMAFGSLALKADFTVNDAEVVSKSYPDFWSDLKTLGFLVQEL